MPSLLSVSTLEVLPLWIPTRISTGQLMAAGRQLKICCLLVMPLAITCLEFLGAGIFSGHRTICQTIHRPRTVSLKSAFFHAAAGSHEMPPPDLSAVILKQLVNISR